MCVWRQTRMSRAVILLWKSSWRLTRWFPLTGTDASQLALKFVLSKGAEMPKSLTKGCRKTQRWHPQLQRNTYLLFRLKSGREVDDVYYGCLSQFAEMSDGQTYVQQRFEQLGHLVNVRLRQWTTGSIRAWIIISLWIYHHYYKVPLIFIWYACMLNVLAIIYEL